jgi:hypothetical protein
MLTLLKEAAVNPQIDVGKMKEIMAMNRELIHDGAVRSFNQAYARLQTKLPRIKKDGTVAYPVNKDKPDGPKKKAFDYATYEAIDEIIRPLMLDEGFSITFDSGPREGGGITVTGTLLHKDGHERRASIPVPIDLSGGKNNIQGIGSAFSYGKRYAVFMLLNIVTEGEDDDGEKGGREFIDLEQCKVINALIDTTKSDVLRFFQFMEIAEVQNIQRKDYAKALNALGTKIVRQEAQHANT